MKNILLTISYDGTVFHGWQTQNNLPTVQQTIEKALAKLCGEAIMLHGAGRTDAGVHAIGQCANFASSASIPVDKWQVALNSSLPTSIRITSADEVPPDFHARFSAVSKHYRYTIENASTCSPLRRNFVWQRHGNIDRDLLQEAARLALGEHNFKAFCASGSKVKGFRRSISHSAWSFDGDMLYYDIVGNGFLYNMVRLLAGGMCDIALGRWSIEAMAEALSSGVRKGTLYCAPPQGLCLMKVGYR